MTTLLRPEQARELERLATVLQRYREESEFAVAYQGGNPSVADEHHQRLILAKRMIASLYSACRALDIESEARDLLRAADCWNTDSRQSRYVLQRADALLHRLDAAEAKVPAKAGVPSGDAAA